MFDRYFSRIRSALGLSKVPIKPRHLYVDNVTGEAFIVESVGPNVQIVRQDAARVVEGTVRKSTLRTALENGIVEHNRDRCETCRDDVR